MNDAIELGKMLHDTPDLFPWVVLAVVMIVIVAQHKRILAYFDAKIESYKERERSDAIIAELIRNNTAALDNNTAALDMIKADRGEERQLIQYHEQASKERIEHIQTVVNRIDETVSQNEKDISILKDRKR